MSTFCHCPLFHRIRYRKKNTLAITLQGKLYISTFRRILHRIIQKQGYDLAHHGFVRGQTDTVLDIDRKLPALGFCHRKVTIRHLYDRIAKIHITLLHDGIVLLIHSCKEDQALRQPRQTIRLMLDTLDPLIIFFHCHLEDFRIRTDDGKRCFDLMACIRDEALLLLVGFCDGADGPLRQKEDQNKYSSQSQKTYTNRRIEELSEALHVPCAVNENIEPPIRILVKDHIAIVPIESLTAAARTNFLDHLSGEV